MRPKLGTNQQQQPIEVVEIDSSSSGSSDEDTPSVTVTPTPPPRTTPNSSTSGSGGNRPLSNSRLQPQSSGVTQPQSRPQESADKSQSQPAGSGYHALDCRSFWKAGGYGVGPIAKAPTAADDQLEHARVHPKFLHSNATSHKWAFGAIAELLDNAVDEVDNGATFVRVDKIDIMENNSPALLFQDDGGGMDPDGIRKCMSLGYSTKKSNRKIGQYGNGFKTSTMRLGADVIVFSRATRASKATQSIGLLSYTFLCKTRQDDVIVPMIDFDISSDWAEPIIYSSQDDWSSNLKTILEWSPFSSKEELMQQFEDVGRHGTKIIIYNLWLNDEGIYELSFDDDDEDIQLRDEANRGGQTRLHKKIVELQSHISYRIRYSLRAYASILYLRKFTNFNIILRGKPVQQYNIADDLKYLKTMAYRPQVAWSSKEVIVETAIGFIKEAPAINVCGFNVYHKNRLIRPFWKVTGEGYAKGNGVVGVLEANFIEPAHDKQDFERSSLFIRLETRLKQMVHEYWRQHCHLVGYQPPGFKSRNMQKEHTTKSQKQLLRDQQNTSLPADDQNDLSMEQPITGFANVIELDHENVSEDGAVSISVDQICEENINLFMKCEEHRQKETELKQTIQELEKELEQARRKCSQLSAHLETKRMQKNMKQQSEKVP